MRAARPARPSVPSELGFLILPRTLCNSCPQERAWHCWFLQLEGEVRGLNPKVRQETQQERQKRIPGWWDRPCTTPVPARSEGLKDLEPSSGLGFVPHPDIPPPGLAGLSQHPVLWHILIPSGMVSWGLELSQLSALTGLCPQRGGSKPWHHPWGCWTGTGETAAQSPCDSFPLNDDNLYQGQFHLSLFFLITAGSQGVVTLAHPQQPLPEG